MSDATRNIQYRVIARTMGANGEPSVCTSRTASAGRCAGG
jgi:hypothetical protein